MPMPLFQLHRRQMKNPVSRPVLDRQLALSRVGGDEELLREIAAIFLEEYPKGLAEIRGAIASAGGKQLESAAHAMKGSVSNFGARPAVEAAAQLEQMGRSQSMQDCGDTLSSLEEALSALRSEL